MTGVVTAGDSSLSPILFPLLVILTGSVKSSTALHSVKEIIFFSLSLCVIPFFETYFNSAYILLFSISKDLLLVGRGRERENSVLYEFLITFSFPPDSGMFTLRLALLLLVFFLSCWACFFIIVALDSFSFFFLISRSVHL